MATSTPRPTCAPAKQSLREYLDKWLAGLPTAGLRPSPSTATHGASHTFRLTLGAKLVDRVTVADLDQLYSTLLTTGRVRKDGGLSPRTVRYLHVVVHKALGDAVRKDELARNVATSASPPSAKSTRPRSSPGGPLTSFGPSSRLRPMTRSDLCCVWPA